MCFPTANILVSNCCAFTLLCHEQVWTAARCEYYLLSVRWDWATRYHSPGRWRQPEPQGGGMFSKLIQDHGALPICWFYIAMGLPWFA